MGDAKTEGISCYHAILVLISRICGNNKVIIIKLNGVKNSQFQILFFEF